jgi:hypothetical protein
MERFGRLEEMDRSFDIEYWQRQGDAAIFRAAWELVELYWRTHGKDPQELRLQRSVESFRCSFAKAAPRIKRAKGGRRGRRKER